MANIIIQNSPFDQVWEMPATVTIDSTYTFPPSASNLGRRIACFNNSANKMTLLPFGAELLNGFASYEIWGNYTYCLEFIATLSGWKRTTNAWVSIIVPTIGAWDWQKTSWAGTDNFTTGGGANISVTTKFPKGTQTMKVSLAQNTQMAILGWRKQGDINISNTPIASVCQSHLIYFVTNGLILPADIDVSIVGAIDFTVSNTSSIQSLSVIGFKI